MRERTIAQEISMRVLDLSHALYRVTDLLARDEPLRRDIRARADEVFSQVVAYAYGRFTDEEIDRLRIAIEILLGYLAMARSLGRMNPMNFFVLEREYRELARTLVASAPAIIIESEKTVEKIERSDEKKVDRKMRIKQTTGAPLPPTIGWQQRDGDVNGRQKVILEYLTQSGQAKVSDFYKTFDGISSKTIQRDLQDLVTRNLIKKEGDKRWTVYMLV